MSKKTSAIYKCLENLEELRKRLIYCCKNDDNVSISTESDDAVRELDNIDFQFQQELKTLKFWFDSLYQYNGKSTSISKKTASAKNGMKGGRPPKEISIAKQRIAMLEEEIIPELDHKIIMADSNEELEDLKNKREQAHDEVMSCKHKINMWLQSKNKQDI